MSREYQTYMKEIIAMIVPLVGGLIGTILGWCGSELSRKWSNRYVKVQVLNNALSWMLDLYFHVYTIKNIRETINDYIKWYTEFLLEKSMTENDIQVVNIEMRKMIVPLFMSTIGEDVSCMSKNYENAIGELAAYYPVAAYRLRGRADIKKVIADVNFYVKKVEEQQTIQIGEYVDMFSTLQDIAQTNITQANILALRNEIITLAKETNRKRRKEILTTLNNIEQPNNQSVQYNELLQEQMTVILQQHPICNA